MSDCTDERKPALVTWVAYAFVPVGEFKQENKTLAQLEARLRFGRLPQLRVVSAASLEVTGERPSRGPR
jgi:hypothetical protein